MEGRKNLCDYPAYRSASITTLGLDSILLFDIMHNHKCINAKPYYPTKTHKHFFFVNLAIHLFLTGFFNYQNILESNIIFLK